MTPPTYQQTLREPVSLSGVGLHSGNSVTMTLLPAPAKTGIRFRRVDLEDKPEIEASVENVGETTRSTTLAKGNVRVHTVEHVLATLVGCGVDNAVVELDANEPPIADGSAQAYCRMIERSGVAPLGEAREVFAVPAPLELQVGESYYTVFPHDRFRLSCTSSDRRGRFTQYASFEITPDTWLRELASARTFCFFEEIEYLIKNGLIKGGSLENAVVIRDDAVLTTEPLRYPDEFVRHKILDMIGDLSLAGCAIQGHVVAIKPSHAANCELARLLFGMRQKAKAATRTFTPPASPPSQTPSTVETKPTSALMEIDEVRRVLPHRYPFLMVDKVISMEEKKVVALKNVTANESYFQGHFPTHPVMPGVLQLEAMAQTAGILMLRKAENYGKIAYFMSAEDVKWRKPVHPGDTLLIEVEMTKFRGKVGRAKGKCTVGGETVSEAEVTFMLVEA